MKKILAALLPKSVLDILLGVYHFCLGYLGALIYRFPSRQLIVVAVTGTKGKSSVTEMVNAIFEAAGYKTALVNSIRIKLADHTEPNLMRMSMPGRMYLQRFLRRAVDAHCEVAVLEMTSEGARQHRHRGIALDALIFTKLAPEHIESHGSYEKYADAKFKIGQALARSSKRPRIMVANADDRESPRYLALSVEKRIGFSLSDHAHSATDHGGHLMFDGIDIAIDQPGEFSLRNALAAAELCRAFGIDTSTIAKGLGTVHTIPGRAERIEAGQDFTVVVDYAHTPDSLEAIYQAYGDARKICVLGSMGGSRDTWNRPEKGRIAAEYCDEVILTNEDPCDDNPLEIIQQIAGGVKDKKPRIIVDRREAIREAVRLARAKDVVLITGKGTDPWIYGAHGERLPWSDAGVAREEIARLKRQV